MSRRRGFTMIELMVVIAIIAILAGLSLAGLSVLRRQQKLASTWDLMTNITTALDQLVRDQARLGADADSNDFLHDPWKFLYKDFRAKKQQPLIDIKLDRLVERIGPGACVRPAAVHTATHICDFFGTNPINVLSLTILNHNRQPSNAATRYVQCMILRSSAGTAMDPKDDLFFGFSSDKGSWRKLRYEDLEQFRTGLDPVPATLESQWVDPLSY